MSAIKSNPSANLDARARTSQPGGSEWARLVGVVQQLSMARDLRRVMEIVRRAARELTDADGATFVLADGDQCFYADEDAIEPLWKGKRFPMSVCVSGWVIRNRRAVVIPDIYDDPRVPTDAYRPTFVKSMAMVPIRTEAPLGAIGNYWASPTNPTPERVALLQALADTASVAVENVRLYEELESRVRVRTRELEAANRELEAFSYTVSHDLRAPLRAIMGFTDVLRQEHGGAMDEEARSLLARVHGAGERMQTLIEVLLRLSRLARQPVTREEVDMTSLARNVADSQASGDPGHELRVEVDEGITASADPAMVRVVLENLLGNARKYAGGRPGARAWVEQERRASGPAVYIVRDNGVGFDMDSADRLFEPFERLHTGTQFPGDGVGLATVRRVVERHGGRVWAEGVPGFGAVFRFTLEEDALDAPALEHA